MNKRTKLLALFLLIAVCAVAWIYFGPGENGGANGSGEKEISIGYFSRAIGYAPYFVADDLGWFDEHPVLSKWKITHTIYGDRATIADSFDSGDLDVLLSAEIPAIMCRAQGNDIRIVDVTGLITLHWLARTELEADSMASLSGKSVAYQSGTSSHYGLLTTLAGAGYDESEYRLRNMKAVEAKTAFETGRIDAWVVWSPFFEQQVVNGNGVQVPGSKYNYATTMTVVNDLREEHPEVVQALTEVLERAKAWIPEHREQAEAIVAEATGQSVEVASKALDNVDFSARLSTDMVDMFQSMAQFLAENDATRRGVVVDIRKDMLGDGIEILPGDGRE